MKKIVILLTLLSSLFGAFEDLKSFKANFIQTITDENSEGILDENGIKLLSETNSMIDSFAYAILYDEKLLLEKN